MSQFRLEIYCCMYGNKIVGHIRYTHIEHSIYVWIEVLSATVDSVWWHTWSGMCTLSSKLPYCHNSRYLFPHTVCNMEPVDFVLLQEILQLHTDCRMAGFHVISHVAFEPHPPMTM